jgi:uncharacterized membrane protein YdfJ with MMPL/SSD domain
VFAWWGRTVYQYRYIVIGVMVALCLGGGVYGISLGQHVTQSGFYDEGSQSVHASVISDEVYGRDRTSHVVAILTPPDGKKVTDPAWQKKVVGELNDVVDNHKDQVVSWVGWLRAPDTTAETVQQMKTEDVRQHSPQGGRRRHDPEELPDHRARPGTGQRRQHPDGRAEPAGQ